jgi:hypothetical protein
MFWKLLSADQWSALATVVSAIVSILNLTVVWILLRYNRATMEILKAQSIDTREQTSVALQTLSALHREKQFQNGRELMRTYGRLLDLNDRFLVLLQEIKHTGSDAAHQRPIKPEDWFEISAAVCEAWPAGTQRTLDLDLLLRRIDIDVALLPLVPEHDRITGGFIHLNELVSQAQPLVREIATSLLEDGSGMR